MGVDGIPIREPEGGQLELLSKGDLDRTYEATLEVLLKPGVKVWAPEAVQLFKEAGAELNEKGLTVRISEELLKETLRRAPSEFQMYGRDPKYRLRFGGRRVHFSTTGQPVNVQDIEG